MNELVTKMVMYRGTEVPVEKLKDKSNILVEVKCSHGYRKVRWNRRHQLCRKCCAEKGVYNTSPKGRSITWGDKISNAKSGVRLSYAHRKALSIAQYGVEHDDWPGFYKKSEIQKIRDSVEYIEFRKSIMKRDHYKCQITGMQGKLNIHHIESVNSNVDKIFDETNVITLHASVHKTFHDIYGRGNNNKKQFEEFVAYIVREARYE